MNKDNKKNFRYFTVDKLPTKKIPIYKEITFFDLKGKEKVKVSSLNKQKLDISKQKNTYLKAENYFEEIQKLQKGEIYVSEVIGNYVGSKIIGVYNEQKAKKMNIKFDPKSSAYAGIENPLGKRNNAIIRYITPIFKYDKKVGYISFAVDFRHIKEYIARFAPSNPNLQRDIEDGSNGNYGFIWDYKYRLISHPREYF